jgi:hypothetical protein
LYVCVERITTAASRSAPRYRVTDKRVPGEDMMRRHVISLSQLDMSSKLKMLTGRIKWIFVLNVSREFSNPSGKSAEKAVVIG